ncbi:pyrophosphohydrolase [Bordetella trematum]|uniref:nucleotide pyrophosphohydrolase n=1 Tax=Bordetella trematum TaxID=123899 RepID=UPI000471FA81|nr:nucleotide pyrophosphohydrolase [Bordetella trematum]SAI44982.1 pyrophosphohydrolase [Bordetella trematum]SPU51323.1 pyrophosphohydrolase [Bordetella trematum]VDH05662.1 MazG nucleotide pyrophosphohydrolase domain [Bordetella trematum]
MTQTQDRQDDRPWIDAARLTQALEQFAQERDWGQFHSPKNLVMALTGEVGELNEIFQWLTEAQSREAARAEETAQAVQDELADVLMYLLRLASVLGVDMNAAVAQKLRKNALKYPVAQSRGSRRKYRDL